MENQSSQIDVYTDGIQIAMTPYDAVLVLQISSPRVEVNKDGASIVLDQRQIGSVRMSLEHAKVLSILLKRHLHAYEEHYGNKIPLHPDVAQQLGISKDEDW